MVFSTTEIIASKELMLKWADKVVSFLTHQIGCTVVVGSNMCYV